VGGLDEPSAGKVPTPDDPLRRVEVSGVTRPGRIKRYVCTVCGYSYDPAVGDPANGISPGTRFEQLPETW